MGSSHGCFKQKKRALVASSARWLLPSSNRKLLYVTVTFANECIFCANTLTSRRGGIRYFQLILRITKSKKNILFYLQTTVYENH